MDKAAHTVSAQDCIDQLETNVDKGLTEQEVQARREKYGPNRIKEAPKPSFFKILMRNICTSSMLLSMLSLDAESKYIFDRYSKCDDICVE